MKHGIGFQHGHFVLERVCAAAVVYFFEASVYYPFVIS